MLGKWDYRNEVKYRVNRQGIVLRQWSESCVPMRVTWGRHRRGRTPVFIATFSEGSIDRVSTMRSGMMPFRNRGAAAWAGLLGSSLESWLTISVKSPLQVRLKPPTPPQPMCGILARRSHFESRFTRRSWSCLMLPYLGPPRFL